MIYRDATQQHNGSWGAIASKLISLLGLALTILAVTVFFAVVSYFGGVHGGSP